MTRGARVTHPRSSCTKCRNSCSSILLSECCKSRAINAVTKQTSRVGRQRAQRHPKASTRSNGPH
eukprot:6208044-Pleurochrysis_carterae.AAC.4